MTVRDWPSVAKVSEWSARVLAHTRGGVGLSGDYAFARGSGASWVASLSVPAMCTRDGLRFRAFLHSLRGRAGVFRVDLPASVQPTATPQTCPGIGAATVHTDCTTYSDGATYTDAHTGAAATAYGSLSASVAAGATSATVSGVPAGYLAAGALVVFGADPATMQLVRVTSVSGSTISFVPRLRAAYPAGTAISAGRVTAAFRLAGVAPPVPLVGGRSEAMTVDIEEAY